jgi:ribosomal protein S26
MAGLVCGTGYSLELDIKKRDEPCVHPAFELARIIAEEGVCIKCAVYLPLLMQLKAAQQTRAA